MEVWGFEPQTYGLQSHRSSQLSYTPDIYPRGRHLTAETGTRRQGHRYARNKREKEKDALEPKARLRTDRNRGCE